MSSPFEPLRTRDLRRIHTGRRALGLDDDTYRDLLERLTGKRSAALLNAKERRTVLDDLHRLGFTPPDHRRPDRRPADRMPPDRLRLMGKIEALLADAQRPWAYVDGVVKRMFDLESIRFCDDQQLRKIVAALVYDQQRRAKKIPPNPPLPKGEGEAGGI